MLTTDISRQFSMRSHFTVLALLCLVLLILLTACTNGSASHAATPTNVVASHIQVGAHPDIIVNGEGALKLTFVGSETQSISTGSLSFPSRKNGNQVTIELGKVVNQDLEIQIPHEANLSVNLTTGGNVIVDTIQGQVAVTLASGTIQVNKFTPHGTNTIQTKDGTINVTFANNTSFSLKAQTNFGAVVSGYSAISPKRDAMKAEASGSISDGSGALVNLIAGYGSITFGPA